MAVVRRGASGDGWFAVSEEGSSFFIPPSLFMEFQLREGMELSGEQLGQLASACLMWQIRKKAVELLSRREHSRHELRLKLLNRSYPAALVEPVLDEMEQRSYLDDRRFAETWINSRLRRNPEGRARLSAGLAARGVSRDIIDDALRFADCTAALEQVYEKLSSRPSMTKEKLLRALMRKGFSYAEIQRMLVRRGLQGPDGEL